MKYWRNLDGEEIIANEQKQWRNPNGKSLA